MRRATLLGGVTCTGAGGGKDERLLLDTVIDTDGDNFQIELNLRLAVVLEGIEAPVNALAAVITDEIAAVVEWFAPALD